MKKAYLILIAVLLSACATDGFDLQPRKKSNIEFGANYKEIQAKIAAGKEYQDLSPDAQIEYIKNYKEYKVMELLISSNKITDDTIRAHLLSLRSPDKIKKAIDEAPATVITSKSELIDEIKETEKYYGDRRLGKPKLPPKGSLVSAKITNGKATVKIQGVIPTMVESYDYEKIAKLGPVSTFELDLYKGRRFNFTFLEGNTEHYVLLNDDMARNSEYMDFLGENVGIDCGNPGGCCFVITSKK